MSTDGLPELMATATKLARDTYGDCVVRLSTLDGRTWLATVRRAGQIPAGAPCAEGSTPVETLERLVAQQLPLAPPPPFDPDHPYPNAPLYPPVRP